MRGHATATEQPESCMLSLCQSQHKYNCFVPQRWMVDGGRGQGVDEAGHMGVRSLCSRIWQGTCVCVCACVWMSMPLLCNDNNMNKSNNMPGQRNRNKNMSRRKLTQELVGKFKSKGGECLSETRPIWGQAKRWQVSSQCVKETRIHREIS